MSTENKGESKSKDLFTNGRALSWDWNPQMFPGWISCKRIVLDVNNIDSAVQHHKQNYLCRGDDTVSEAIILVGISHVVFFIPFLW